MEQQEGQVNNEGPKTLDEIRASRAQHGDLDQVANQTVQEGRADLTVTLRTLAIAIKTPPTLSIFIALNPHSETGRVTIHAATADAADRWERYLTYTGVTGWRTVGHEIRTVQWRGWEIGIVTMSAPWPGK